MGILERERVHGWITHCKNWKSFMLKIPFHLTKKKKKKKTLLSDFLMEQQGKVCIKTILPKINHVCFWRNVYSFCFLISWDWFLQIFNVTLQVEDLFSTCCSHDFISLYPKCLAKEPRFLLNSFYLEFLIIKVWLIANYKPLIFLLSGQLFSFQHLLNKRRMIRTEHLNIFEHGDWWAWVYTFWKRLMSQYLKLIQKNEFKAMMGHKIHSEIQCSNRNFLAIVHSSLKPQN
jgi:hypothetical protein